jgi:hypothetical protein
MNFKDLKIGTRLYVLVGFLSALLIGLGSYGIGFYGFQSIPSERFT